MDQSWAGAGSENGKRIRSRSQVIVDYFILTALGVGDAFRRHIISSATSGFKALATRVWLMLLNKQAD